MTFLKKYVKTGNNFSHASYLPRLSPIFLLCSLILISCASASGSPSGGISSNTNASGKNGTSNPVSRTGFYFNTVISVTLYDSPDDETGEELLNGCMELCARYESLFSAHLEGTDVDRINSAGGSAVTVDAETAELIAYTLPYSRLTDGSFDVSVGGVSSMWNFTGEPPGPVPDEDELKEALSHVGYENIEITGTDNSGVQSSAGDDTIAGDLAENETASGVSSENIANENTQEAPTVRLIDPEAAIDLGAVAKGYIADRLKEYLTGEGIGSAIINLGGNVLLIGSKPDGSDFVVGVQDPFAAETDVIATVSASDKSVVTSGVYERYFMQDGVRYHHILDAKTGYPAETGLVSVTIYSDSSAQGDALSTVCFLMGKEKAMEYIEALDGIEALFVDEDGTLTRTSGFPEV